MADIAKDIELAKARVIQAADKLHEDVGFFLGCECMGSLGELIDDLQASYGAYKYEHQKLVKLETLRNAVEKEKRG